MSSSPVVLLHGVGLDHSIWEPLIDALGPDLDVRAFDLPGHGTRAPVEDGVGIADLADLVAAEVPAGAHVVGFSLGALIGQHLAITRPDLVRTLTCVSAVHRRSDAERRAVLDRLAASTRDYETGVRASLDRWYAGTAVPEHWVDHTRQVLLATDRASFLACYRAFAFGDRQVADGLGRITAPTLAITGSDDPGSTPLMTYRMAADIPDCRFTVLPATRHMLPVQRPQELARHVTHLIGADTHANT